MSAESLIWLAGAGLVLIGSLAIAITIEPVEMRYSEDDKPRIEAYTPESKEEAVKLNKKADTKRCVRKFGIAFLISGVLTQIIHFFYLS